jgi:hypothetical protein
MQMDYGANVRSACRSHLLAVMSLFLTFSGTSTATASLGPFPEVWFEGETIRARADGDALAVHRSHTWEVNGGRYVRVDCNVPVYVRFVAQNGSSSERKGPFIHLSCINGVCYVDREVFAIVDRTQDDWYAISAERHWHAMVLSPAA